MVNAQCCSTGSPVGASVFVGILAKNHLRAILYYRHSYSRTYFENDHRSGEDVQLKLSRFNYTGAVIGYGLSRRVTFEAEAGYYFDKTQVFRQIDFTTRGHGLSNGTLSVKYGTFVKPAQNLEFTVGAGLRFPFTTHPQMIDGVQLNRDVQPSTNAFGLSGTLFFNKGFPAITLRLFTINRYDLNLRDPGRYRYGNLLMNSLYASKKVAKNLYILLQLRNEWKTHDDDAANPNEEGTSRVVNSGYDLVTVSPQVSYGIAGKWNVSVSGDLPVYKFYNGKQMTPSWSLALSLTRDFDLGKKQPSLKPNPVN